MCSFETTIHNHTVGMVVSPSRARPSHAGNFPDGGSGFAIRGSDDLGDVSESAGTHIKVTFGSGLKRPDLDPFKNDWWGPRMLPSC